jgi:palmitoyltransferase
VGGPEASPQRRFLSEGELLRGEQQSYTRTNNTVDNIRELAGSPQRGVYTWKDTSPNAYSQQRPPAYDHYRSNPTSPTQRYYAPPPRGGVPVYPPQQSPQVKKKTIATPSTPSDNRRRPMSFVRALEMSDSMEIQNAQDPRRGTTPTPDRASVYDMNYEISV